MADGSAAKGVAKHAKQQDHQRQQNSRNRREKQGGSRFACGKCKRVYFHVASCQRHARTCGLTLRFPCSCAHAPFASFEALRIHARRMQHAIPEEAYRRNKKLLARRGARGRRKPHIIELPPEPQSQPRPQSQPQSQPQTHSMRDAASTCSPDAADLASSVPCSESAAHRRTQEARSNAGTQTLAPQAIQEPLPLHDVGLQVGQTCATSASTSTVSVQHGVSAMAECSLSSAQTQTQTLEEHATRDTDAGVPLFDAGIWPPASSVACSFSPATCSATCQTEFTRDKSVPLLHLTACPPPAPPAPAPATNTAHDRQGGGAVLDRVSGDISGNSTASAMAARLPPLGPLPLPSSSQSLSSAHVCEQVGPCPAAARSNGGCTETWTSTTSSSGFSVAGGFGNGEGSALDRPHGFEGGDSRTGTVERATSPLFHTVGTDCSELFQDIGTDCDGLFSSDVGTDCFDLLFSSTSM